MGIAYMNPEVSVPTGTQTTLAESAGDLRAIACTAALEVGDMLRKGFAETSSEISAKADFHDLVTDYDVEAEQVIRKKLAEEVPDSRWVGEELGTSGNGDVTWYIDPIDGTSNFAAGIPFFCVSIGVEVAGELVAGVIYDPVCGELFSADISGAYLNDNHLRSVGSREQGTALLATDFPAPRVSTWPAANAADAAPFLDAVHSFRTVRRLGSGALMLAYVAAGRADVTMGFDTKPWDVAAGAFLVRRAGGTYRPVVEGATPSTRFWEEPHYVAHVQGFDLDGSCLGALVGGSDE